MNADNTSKSGADRPTSSGKSGSTAMIFSRIKRSIKVQRSNIVQASINSLFYLLVIPPSIWLGFVLTNYLSSPELTVEDAKAVLVHEPIQIESGLVTRVLTNEMHSILLRENQSLIFALQAEQYMPSLSEEQRRSTLETVVLLDSLAAERQRQIDYLQQHDFSQEDEHIYRQFIETYLVRLSAKSAKDAFSEAQKVASTETQFINSYLGDLESLRESLESQGEVHLYIMLTVLNRGSSIGFVRSNGEFVFGNNVPSVKLSRSAAPKNPNSRSMGAVPVDIPSPSDPDSLRPAAVGRVEANSMSEIWFSTEALLDGQIDKAAILAGRAVLYDQDMGAIGGSVTALSEQK